MAWVTIANLTGPPGDAATMAILDKTPRIRGNADGLDLNTLYVPSQHFGDWEITSFGGATPLPPEMSNRGVLNIKGGTQFSCVQTITTRDQNMSWTRTGTNTNATPPEWTSWKSSSGANGSANGRDLNTMYKLIDFGVWGFDYTSSTLNMPPGIVGRGVMEVFGNTQFTVIQRVTCREQNVTWQRTGTNLGATPPRWADWSVVGAPNESSRVELGMIGDSLVASHNLVPSLSAALPGIYCYSRGWNGETTDGLVIRMGARDIFWNVVGGSIPASGSVALTTAQKIEPSAADTYYTGLLAGVPGRINVTGTGYSFLRDADGSAVTVSGLVKFNPTWTQTTRQHMIGILAGRNDVSLNAEGVEGSVPRHVVANTRRLIEWMFPVNKLFFLLGTINKTSEPSGSTGHANVVEINRTLGELYPGQYVGIREYLINQVIFDLGITPTSADLANMANDCPPPSVMVDDTHYTDEAAEQIVNNVIVPWLKGVGYVAA